VHAFLALWLAITACGLFPPSLNQTEIPIEAHVPAPPAPLTIPPGAPEEQALALADAIGPNSPDRLAGWLAVYDAFHIPVFRDDGTPIGATGDDPIGPHFWRVWFMSGTSASGLGFALMDFVKVFADPGDTSFDATEFSAVLLDDLRAAAASDDPQVRTFGLFVAETIRRRSSGLDILDPAATADQAIISGDMAEFLSWVVIRGLMFTLPELEGTSRAPHVQLASARLSPPLQAGQVPCSEMWGDEDVTKWANWALGKFAGGIEIPFMEEGLTPGIIDLVQEYLGVSKNVQEMTGKITKKIGTAAAVLSLAMLMSAIELNTDMGPNPLERTKSTSDHGKEATIHFRLTLNPDKLPDGNNLLACAASFLLNVFGIPLNFPAGGAISGAEVVIKGGKGFGGGDFKECGGEAYVQFMDYRQLRQDTDKEGLASVEVQGCRQKQEIPEDAQPMMREFTIRVSAQPEAITGDTIANVFFSGLSFGAGDREALISGIVDIVKTFHWDLGEHPYPLKDWLAQFDLQVKISHNVEGPHMSWRWIGEVLIPLTFAEDGTFTGSASIKLTGTHGGICAGSGEANTKASAEGSINSQTGQVTLRLLFAEGMSQAAEHTWQFTCPGGSFQQTEYVGILIDGTIPLTFGSSHTLTVTYHPQMYDEAIVTLVEKTNP
jgi:hypothetical protein